MEGNASVGTGRQDLSTYSLRVYAHDGRRHPVDRGDPDRIMLEWFKPEKRR
jgi:hypothetical protein